jgi:hypothetical protein
MLLVFHNVQQRGHEQDGCDPRKCCSTRPTVLSDPTRMLVGLNGEFRVLLVQRIGPTAVKMIIKQIARDGTRINTALLPLRACVIRVRVGFARLLSRSARDHHCVVRPQTNDPHRQPNLGKPPLRGRCRAASLGGRLAAGEC